MNKVDQLPSELISLILSYIRKRDLPSCALVNKSFYREALPLLWHTIDIDSEKTLIAFTSWLMQSPHGHHVRSLSITSMYAYTDILEQVQDVPYLESLDIPRYCPDLASLIVDCGRYPDRVAYRIAQAIVISAGQYCKQLTKLALYDCMYSNYDDLFDALKDAPLTEFCLTLPNQLEDTAQRFLETAPLALHRYPLTTLSINVNKDATRFISTINTHRLTWPNLTTFDLSFSESLTDAMALTFVQAHPTLKCLNLDYSHLTDAFLDGLDLPNLTTLSVVYNPAITAAGICRLITNYGGRLGRVYCEGCGISPEDIPNDKSYHYQLLWDDEDAPEVEWFDGTSFYKSDCTTIKHTRFG